MRICHITTVHGAFDSRIFQKECRTLAAKGYQVFEVAPHVHDVSVDGVQVIGIPRFDSRFKRMLISPWIAFAKALRTKSEIYHFHDPEFIPAALVMKCMGKHVVYDAHENLPAQIRTKPWLSDHPWMANAVAWGMGGIEMFAARAFDAVVSVVPEILDRFRGTRKVLLRNVPVLESVRSAPIIARPAPEFACCYAGALTRIRGIKEIISAVGLTRHRVSLWLLGHWESDAFREECAGLPGFQNVVYLGVVAPDAVYSYLKQANVGLVPLHPVANYMTSLPVKSFEYLACGLPVIISDFPYFRKIYGKAVWYVDPQSPDEIAERIDWIVEHQSAAKAKASEGRKLVERDFNWEKEHVELLRLYKALCDAKR